MTGPAGIKPLLFTNIIILFPTIIFMVGLFQVKYNNIKNDKSILVDKKNLLSFSFNFTIIYYYIYLHIWNLGFFKRSRNY
jgi:hypothetical protein